VPLKKKRIPCYVLVFDQVEIIDKTLASLARYTDQLEVIIVENPSNHTPEIKKIVADYGAHGLVKRYYLFDDNITNNAMGTVLELELKRIKKSRYIVTTDGDLTCEDPWLEEEVAILEKHPEVFTCGVSLDMSNLPLKAYPDARQWIPPDKNVFDDFYEVFTGTHLQLTRGKQFYDFFRWKDKNNVHLVDGAMHTYCEQVLHSKWARTKKATAYHLTWDLYNDPDNAYTKLKNSKSFDETWHHKRTSDYTLTTY
jgi:glycosyltransferase involved in cell wall biosynthesis